MDCIELPPLPQLQGAGWCHWRIQRQIHGQSNGAARRQLRHAAGTHPSHLPQFLLPARPLAVYRSATGTTLMTEQDNSVQLRSDVREGRGRQPRSTPSKYLYDARGSELFEQITRLKEYYVTRADLALHRNCLPEISDRVGPQAHIIELGSGAGTKTRLLLQGLNQPRAYTPIEISAAALEQSAKALAEAFPNLLRSEEHTSELQSRGHLVCRLLLEKKNITSRRCGLSARL